MSLRNKLKITYLILLVLFTIFVLLDTFIIPKSMIKVETPEQNYDAYLKSLDGVFTQNSYHDDDISIEISSMRRFDSNIYIADIYINDIKYLKSAFANNEFGRNIKESTSNIAKSSNAILAINGDYYGFRDYGCVLRNGIIYRDIKNPDEKQQDLVIYSDGRLEVEYENKIDLQQLKENGAIHVISFGPELIHNNEIVVHEKQEVPISSPSNPRTAIGIYDKGHYIFVVSDGRTDESKGLSLYQLSQCIKELGCTMAYNLDGGGSTTMFFNNQIVNIPTDGNHIEERRVSDILYIGK